MMALENPYSPSRPIEDDRRFIDQDEAVTKIERYLEKSMSCAIIGGEGMGKTSILKSIQRMYSKKANVDQSQSQFIPIYFEPGQRRSDSLRSIYQLLIDQTISQTKSWLENCVDGGSKEVSDSLNLPRCLRERPGPTMHSEDLKDLEKDLDEIIKAIHLAIANTKLLFLFDGIFDIKNEDCRNAFVEHWLVLLVTKSSHLVIIITCLKDFSSQFGLCGSLPVTPIDLDVFGQEDSYEVMNRPLKDTLNLELMNEVADEIHNFAGGYPLALQRIMSDLWDDAKMGEQINITYVENHTKDRRRKHSDIVHWIKDMMSKSENKMLRDVFERLVTEDGSCERTRLARSLGCLSVNELIYHFQLDGALSTLRSWGVVREVGREEYQISGELFRFVLDKSNGRETMDEPQERAVQFEDQLRDLLSLINRKDFADLYDGDVDQTKALLREHLATLLAAMQHLRDLKKEIIVPTDPAFITAKSAFIKKIEEIGIDLESEINPKFESIAKQLAEKAKRAEAGDKGLLQQALEALDEAIASVAAPVARAAALTTTIKTIMDFFEAMPK